jgi:hypothetical protein
VQLEQGFLQHIARLVRSKVIITARIMPWVVEKHSFLHAKAPFIWMNGAWPCFGLHPSVGASLLAMVVNDNA